MPDSIENFKKLVEIIAKLRSPEGCPWDREQNHKSIKRNLLEETYETIDAIDSNNPEELKEELGDLLLQVLLHAQMAEEAGQYSIDDISKTIGEKLIRRHPHVFGDITVKDSDEVIDNWDKIKKKEKPERDSALSGVVKSQPALMSAQQLSKKAVKVGFEWPSEDSLKDCFLSEVKEFYSAVEAENKDQMEEELGDILFSIVNIARWHKIDAETALIKANRKFKMRFQLMESLADKELSEFSIDELDGLWNRAKSELKENS